MTQGITNKAMSRPQQENLFDQSITPIDAYHVLALEQEVEIGQEQIKSLQQEVLEKEQLVQKLEQELRELNKSLLLMNAELVAVFCSQPIPFAQAKEVAQTIVTKQQSIGESLAQLLNVIYGSSIEAWELQQTPTSVLKSSPRTALEQFLPEHESLQTQIKELRTGMMTLRTQMTKLQARSVQLKSITKFGSLHGKST